MFYLYKISYYDSEENRIFKYKGFVTGKSYEEVMKNLAEHYGDKEIEEVFLTPFSPDKVLEYDESMEDLFEETEKKMLKKIIW